MITATFTIDGIVYPNSGTIERENCPIYPKTSGWYTFPDGKVFFLRSGNGKIYRFWGVGHVELPKFANK